MAKLTGRTRYRVETRRFKKPLVVLQVEETYRNYFDSHDVTHWRDATIEDLQVEGVKK